MRHTQWWWFSVSVECGAPICVYHKNRTPQILSEIRRAVHALESPIGGLSPGIPGCGTEYFGMSMGFLVCPCSVLVTRFLFFLNRYKMCCLGFQVAAVTGAASHTNLLVDTLFAPIYVLALTGFRLFADIVASGYAKRWRKSNMTKLGEPLLQQVVARAEEKRVV